jgi:glycosyltransferase involved in cell wall biosynthesis
MNKLSLALATYNEESNILDCINSCKGLVDEVVVVDGCSTDKTGELALQAGATVIRTQNLPMFHINKQKAIEACTGNWILQLDADERVTSELAEEIKKVINMTDEEIHSYQENLKEKELFLRHQSLVQPTATNYAQRTTNYSAFFIPRLNFFLGGYLRSGGVYPDGVIRLIKKGKAYLPCKDVHELMEVEGATGWLANPLIHKDSPTFKRYLERNSRYIDQLVEELSRNTQHVTRNIQKNVFKMLYVTCYMLYLGIDWVIIKPISTFFSLLIRHKGILDGWRGVVWAFFSSLRFARAYWRFVRG